MAVALKEKTRYSDALTPRVFDAHDQLPLIAFMRRVLGDKLTLSVISYYNEINSAHEQPNNGLTVHPDKQVSFRAHAAAVDELGINDALVDFFKNNFSTLPSDEQSLSTFIDSQVKVANQIVENIRKQVFPDYGDQYSLKNGIQVPENNLLYPAQIMLGNGFIDPRLKFEIRRQQLIMLLSMQLDDEYKLSKLNNNLHTINKILEDNLYEGMYGETTVSVIYSLHHNITNECVQTQNLPPSDTIEGYHWKMNTLETRKIPGIGNVMSHYREKSKTSSVLKAIHKAITGKNGRQISASNVRDISGYFFVAETPEKQKQLCESVLSLLCQHLPNCEFAEDDQVGSGRKQSSEVQWMRRQVYFGEIRSYPIEMSFFHARSYYNYRYKVGSMAENGEFDSSRPLAHELFIQRRAEEVGDLLFPVEFYPRPHSFVAAREARKQRTINELRNKNRHSI